MTVETGFAQVPNEILRDARLTAPSRLLYSILKSYAWQDDNSFPGQKRLAEEMGCSDRMVRSYLQELEESGLVAVEQRGKMATNRYYLTDRIKSEWKPISTSDRKHTSTHKESDRKQVSAMSGSTVPVMTGSTLPTNNTHGTKTQIKNTTTPLPPKAVPAEKPMVAVDEKLELRKTIRTLIPGPPNQIISGATNSRLHEIVDNNPAEWVRDGFRITADAGKGLSYLASILGHWTRHGKDCRCVDPKADKPILIQKPYNHPLAQTIPFPADDADMIRWREAQQKRRAKIMDLGPVQVGA
jgi:biotin operon repressor